LNINLFLDRSRVTARVKNESYRRSEQPWIPFDKKKQQHLLQSSVAIMISLNAFIIISTRS